MPLTLPSGLAAVAGGVLAVPTKEATMMAPARTAMASLVLKQTSMSSGLSREIPGARYFDTGRVM
ncbi:hypothetical protein [Nonomuraea salmonea]|uniref:hypothetical protein n=1 Tax=Nonomuraea salmonea TaxID=46181 RepID=UPI0031E7A7CB